MLSIFQERGISHEEVQRCESLLLQQRELFAEEEIKSFFPKLRSFVLQVSLYDYVHDSDIPCVLFTLQ
jgi:hypothetical protein